VNMEIILSRFFQSYAVTFGMLHIVGVTHKPIFTLENPWKDNKPNVSCIPLGTYDCVAYNGMKYADVYKVLDVPGRESILFHRGNYEHDTRGCILPGLGCDPALHDPMVTKSKPAMNYMRELIKKQPFTLEIRGL